MQVPAAARVRYDSGPNMTPMVDIVLVILIFLMLAGSFAGAEHFIVTQLPINPHDRGGVDSSLWKQTTTLEIRVDSQWHSMAPRPDADDPNADLFRATIPGSHVFYADAGSLQIELARRLAEFKAAGTPTDQVQVVINPNRYTKYKNLVQVQQAAMLAGYQKIAFAAAH